MLKHALITRADQEYLICQYHTSSMRQQKFMCLVISLNENYVEKFLDCLSQTAVEYVPHDELLKKIRNGTYVHISIVTYISVVVAM